MLTLGQPNPRRGNGDERLVAPVKLVVSRGDSTKMLDTTEKSLDQVAPLVDMPVVGALLGSVRTRGNDRLCTACCDGVDQRVAVVGFVGSNRLGRDALKQWLGFADVGRLAGGQPPAREVAERFN